MMPFLIHSPNYIGGVQMRQLVRGSFGSGKYRETRACSNIKGDGQRELISLSAVLFFIRIYRNCTLFSPFCRMKPAMKFVDLLCQFRNRPFHLGIPDHFFYGQVVDRSLLHTQLTEPAGQLLR